MSPFPLILAVRKSVLCLTLLVCALAARSATPVPPSAADHWAFRPVQKIAPPTPSAPQSQAKTPIDAWLLKNLAQHQLSPSPPIDRSRWLRRVTYKLTGLPPTESELQNFLADLTPDAENRVIDRLLASPRYGERWARFWLDVARYSDTKGYVYGDREETRFVQSAPYRDWVIRAFNTDLPYDRFLALQIAADSLAQQPDDLPAMGFLTLGRRFLGVVHDIIDDRIDVVMRGLQGLTLNCARCHDHKFDPIPTRDYYSLYGIFNSSIEALQPAFSPTATNTSTAAFFAELEARKKKLQDTVERKKLDLENKVRLLSAAYLAEVPNASNLPTEENYVIRGPDDLNPAFVRQWAAEIERRTRRDDPLFLPWKHLAALWRTNPSAPASLALDSLTTASAAPPTLLAALRQSSPTNLPQTAAVYGKFLADFHRTTQNSTNPPPPDPQHESIRKLLYDPDSPTRVIPGPIVEIEWYFDEGTRVEISKLQAEIDRWILQNSDAPPFAVTLVDRAKPRTPRVFHRGNPALPRDEVPRQFLQLFEGPQRTPFREGSGRHELALAIANPSNPLTARVLVNRIWAQHFGAGLVKTTSDFGLRSDPPSHPELLDWLAHFLIETRSIKALQRLIVQSAVYAQDSGPAPNSDPDNRLLSVFPRQRLDFEALRDSLFAVTGELDLRMGGPAGELLGDSPSPRRAVYGRIDRQFLPPVLRIFDFANPDTHSPGRFETFVPQQALFLLNNPFTADRARALARSLTPTHASHAPSLQENERLARSLFRQTLGQNPDPDSLAAAVEFLNAGALEPSPPPPKTSPFWVRGWGRFDTNSNRITHFQKLPVFTGDSWQGGSKWPDATLGWVRWTPTGGHPGNDAAHAAILRWIAPTSGAFEIAGVLVHESPEGNGIHARIVSNQHGLLVSERLHRGAVRMASPPLSLKAGDTLDFYVDIADQLGYDDFLWSPEIRQTDSSGRVWRASEDRTDTPTHGPRPLSPVEQLAQALLLSNEFSFID